MRKNKPMIIVFVLVIFLTGFKGSCFAQFNNFGFSFGVNFAKWSGDADSFANDLSFVMNQEGFSGIDFEAKARTGVSFGIFYEYKFNKLLLIRPELTYTMKGAKFRHEGPVTFTYDYETYFVDLKEDLIMVMNYIELPVLLRFNFVDIEKKTVPYLIAGPCISYLVTSKMKVKVDVDGEKETDSEKYDEFESFDWGLYGGLGIAFSKSASLELRYNYNFKPVVKEKYDDGYEVNNSMISINFMMGFEK